MTWDFFSPQPFQHFSPNLARFTWQIDRSYASGAKSQSKTVFTLWERRKNIEKYTEITVSMQQALKKRRRGDSDDGLQTREPSL